MKNIKLIIILFLTSFIMFSCSREEEQEVELSGIWKYDKVKLELNDSWTSLNENEKVLYKLKTDYKFETAINIYPDLFVEVGKWNINDETDIISLDWTDNSYAIDQSLKILEKNGNEITLKNFEGWYELWVRQ